jgi:MoaA/NifB/PqqE/SkfB family radical SAM enzyme
MHKTHVIEKLPILILYPHSRCNCRCVMCDIWKIDTITELSIADLDRHANDLEALAVRWVVFSGGESLMICDMFSFSVCLGWCCLL